MFHPYLRTILTQARPQSQSSLCIMCGTFRNTLSDESVNWISDTFKVVYTATYLYLFIYFFKSEKKSAFYQSLTNEVW